ncbi:hypothetical protein Zmor_003070 [Zophobas morio]|uniref:Uncharacterized protein n=1 Tax=Zophobas morio TaxID=2755281 RepID=A0AA38M1P4_9CUCU|nr:hypothetical protein Zmor_003070 [Zophobas morio]
MEKLTQFVSNSFENNNNTTVSEQCLNLTSAIKTSPAIKMEDEFQTPSEDTKRPKNWLISDLQKNSTQQTFGIDLRLNNSQILYNSYHQDKSESEPAGNQTLGAKWFDTNADVKTPSPKNSYCSSSPIDLEDSKSCPETVASEKNEDDKQEHVDKSVHGDERKLCELLLTNCRRVISVILPLLKLIRFWRINLNIDSVWRVLKELHYKFTTRVLLIQLQFAQSNARTATTLITL